MTDIPIQRINASVCLDAYRPVTTHSFATSPAHYLGNPQNLISILSNFQYDEIAVFDRTGILIDTDIGFLSRLAVASSKPIAYAGGIESYDQAIKIVTAGFERVIFQSLFFESYNLESISSFVRSVGRQSSMLCIDLKSDPVFVFSHLKYGTPLSNILDLIYTSPIRQLFSEIIFRFTDYDGLCLNDRYVKNELIGHVRHLRSRIHPSLLFGISCGISDERLLHDIYSLGVDSVYLGSLISLDPFYQSALPHDLTPRVL
jgi:hypothetical protein